jgi:hypothetical protein
MKPHCLENQKGYNLRNRNPVWDRKKSVDDHGSTTRVLFTEEIRMENFNSCDEHYTSFIRVLYYKKNKKKKCSKHIYE